MEKTRFVCTQQRQRWERVNSHHLNRITVCARWTRNEQAKELIDAAAANLVPVSLSRHRGGEFN